jgi:hypothetical protein
MVSPLSAFGLFNLFHGNGFGWTQVYADIASSAGFSIKDLRLALCACLQDSHGTNANADKRRTRRTFGVINKNHRFVFPHDESTIK